MANKSRGTKLDHVRVSSELTASELVQMTQQGELVEAELSPAFRRRTLIIAELGELVEEQERAEMETFASLRMQNVSPKNQIRRSSTNPEVPSLPPIASASAPSLNNTDHSSRQHSSPKFRAHTRDHLPHIGLMQDDLRDIPPAEALKQILIERAGTLKRAYKAMDINKNGVVNCFEFEKGLQRVGFYGSPLESYRSALQLFQELDTKYKGFESISGETIVKLQDLLGYVPLVKSFASDTRSDWISYNNKASAQKSHLARKPLWRNRFMELSPDYPEVEHRQARRALRRQLVDERQSGRGLNRMEEKRKLVRGLVAEENRLKLWNLEHRKMSEQQERIGVAIHDCGKSRSELVALQRAMAQLVPPEAVGHHRRPTFTHLRSQLNLGLKGQRTDEFDDVS